MYPDSGKWKCKYSEPLPPLVSPLLSQGPQGLNAIAEKQATRDISMPVAFAFQASSAEELAGPDTSYEVRSLTVK